VAVGAPLLPGLRHEDLNDAVEHAGLRSWLADFMLCPARLSEPRAHLAARDEEVYRSSWDMFRDPPRNPMTVRYVK
jgi:hypothetical protein